MAHILLFVIDYFKEQNMTTNRHLSGAERTSFTLEELTQAADMLESSGRYEEAIDLYRQWLKYSKEEHKHVAWFNYGWLLQKQNLMNLHPKNLSKNHNINKLQTYLWIC